MPGISMLPKPLGPPHPAQTLDLGCWDALEHSRGGLSNRRRTAPAAMGKLVHPLCIGTFDANAVGNLSCLFRKCANKLARSTGGRPKPVTQIFNLPYRRFVIGRAPDGCYRFEPAHAPQNAILRYGRLNICVTRLQPIRG